MLDRLKPQIRPFYPDNVLVSALKNDGMPHVLCAPFPLSAIVMGRAGDIGREVNLQHAMADHIPIFRRKGGGCAVFLDPGNLVVSAAFPAPGFLDVAPLFKRANQWLLNGLEACGIYGVYTDGISDIVLEDQKIGGSCFYRAKSVAYYSASILVSSDCRPMERYLRFPPRWPEYRRRRSHLDFVTTLNSRHKDLTPRRLARVLKPFLLLSDLRQ